MPSVMTTASGIWASIASTTADLAKAGGTKMTDTFAPVSAMASATEPNTGTVTPPSNSTVWPAFLGLTPPTMVVPEASIRWVCFMPSEPVMPWTMTLESPLRKIAIVGPAPYLDASSAALRAAPSLLDVVAVQPDDERLGGLVTQRLERADDAVGDRVARRDPAEDVDEHRLHLLVTEDDVQAVGHHLGRGATADVEEVGGLRLARELLAGVGDDVQGRHDQARAVADDADGV